MASLVPSDEDAGSPVGGFLLDVNVVIALLDPSHIHHDRAHAWFDSDGKHRWFTCPLVENGVVKIVSHPRYPNPSSPSTVLAASRRYCRSLAISSCPTV